MANCGFSYSALLSALLCTAGCSNCANPVDAADIRKIAESSEDFSNTPNSPYSYSKSLKLISYGYSPVRGSLTQSAGYEATIVWLSKDNNGRLVRVYNSLFIDRCGNILERRGSRDNYHG